MRLLAEIRQYYGQGFLADTKVVVAHPVVRNNFLAAYKLNFLFFKQRKREGEALCVTNPES